MLGTFIVIATIFSIILGTAHKLDNKPATEEILFININSSF